MITTGTTFADSEIGYFTYESLQLKKVKWHYLKRILPRLRGYHCCTTIEVVSLVDKVHNELKVVP